MSGMRTAPVLYRMLKRLLPPLINPYFHLHVEGLDNVPQEGGAILACNHLSFIDSLVLPLNVPRPVYFLGKAEYFESWRTRWFFEGVGVVPVYREGGRKGRESLETGMRILRGGDLLGVYPEGTRSPDGRMYKGKTGPVRMAIATSVPVVPCAVQGSDVAMPISARIPRRHPVTVLYGRPLDFSRYHGQERDPFVVRAATDELMCEIMMLSGQQYVDEYATRVKSGQVDPGDIGGSDRPGDRDGGNDGRRRAAG